MNVASKLLSVAKKVEKLSPGVGGIFSYADLSNIIASGSVVGNSRIISKLVGESVLTKIQRGLYAAPKFDLWLLASRIEPNCYISMDTVLAEQAIIGTVPKRIVSAVIIDKRKRRVATPKGEIVFHSIKKDLFFGVITKSNGVGVATPEKAYIDLLYFYQKGTRFAIDPLREVNISKLDWGIIKEYLTMYKNPKFIKFVEGLLYDKR
jgi:predicted transcriptional regulator of viral defense system